MTYSFFMMNLLKIGILCSLAGFLIGCASPAHRIKKNPELFASFAPEVQAKVSEGKIETGYTPDMVRIAYGKPGRVIQRQTEEVAEEIWVYYSYHTRQVYVGQTYAYSYYYRDGQRCRIPRSVPQYVTHHEERERSRVIFRDGKVRSFETSETI